MIRLLLSIALFLPVVGFGASQIDSHTEGGLIPDYFSKNMVFRVLSSGEVEPVFPPSKESESRKWAAISQVMISPLQQKIAYCQNNDLWVYDLTTKQRSQLTHIGKPYTKKLASVEIEIARWSWDESKILYSVIGGITEDPEGYSPTLGERPAEYGLHIYDLKSATSKVLPSHISGGAIVAWLEDEDFVLSFPFGGSQERKHISQLVRFKPVSEVETNLTEKMIGSDFLQVDTTRDGQWLASDKVDWRRHTSELIKLNLKTGEMISITPVGRFAEYQWPTFSPSGNRIAYLHKTEHSKLTDLVVDGKAVYSFSGNYRFYWINESTMALAFATKVPDELVVLDVNTGSVKTRQKWK